MSLFNPSRDEVRAYFFDTWSKYQAHQILTDLEKIAASVILMHPEYHPVLSAPERYREQEYFPELGETNPFLHMSLHLSVLEQLSINQPTGIVQIYQTLIQKHQSEHEAQHDILECLGDAIWRAQRNGQALDATEYFTQLQRKAGMISNTDIS